MRRSRMMMLGLLAMFAFSAVAAGTAEAAGSPSWITKAGGELAAGNTRSIKASNNTGATTPPAYKLTGGTTVVECAKQEGTGTLSGGSPGGEQTVVTFKECKLEGRTLTECYARGLKPEAAAGDGEITVALKSLSVYPKGKLGTETEMLEAFFPEGEEASPNLFSEFELNGTNCGAITLGTKLKVTATGTEVTEPPFKRKCGVIGEVGKLTAAGVFEKTVSGEEVVKGGLSFPSTAITEGEVETAGGLKVVKCKLEFAAVAAKLVGTSKVETVAPEAFGWKVGPAACVSADAVTFGKENEPRTITIENCSPVVRADVIEVKTTKESEFKAAKKCIGPLEPQGNAGDKCTEQVTFSGKCAIPPASEELEVEILQGGKVFKSKLTGC